MALTQDQANQMAAAAAQAVDEQRAFIMNSFRGQIYITDQMDVQDTPLYDTITYAASDVCTTNNSQFFTNVTGVGNTKNFAQTNLTKSQQLVAPEAFSVFGIRMYWAPNILRTDVNNFLANTAFEFWMGQKYYQRANLWHFAAGAGLSGATTNTSESFYTNGIPNRNSMHVLQIPLVIANQMQFYGQFVMSQPGSITLNASGTGATFVCQLAGLYARGVQ